MVLAKRLAEVRKTAGRFLANDSTLAGENGQRRGSICS